MEPEESLDEHVNRRDRIIPMTEVTKFVCDDSFYLDYAHDQLYGR
jgi:hypothetical protein